MRQELIERLVSKGLDRTWLETLSIFGLVELIKILEGE